jgi:hypothetical protein
MFKLPISRLQAPSCGKRTGNSNNKINGSWGILSSEIAESSLERISVPEEIWEDISSKLHPNSTVTFEEFSRVDNNLETEPFLMDRAVLGSVTEPSGEIRSDSEDGEDDKSEAISVTFSEASECLDKLKTSVVKQECAPDIFNST